jgi:hypothetical protein
LAGEPHEPTDNLCGMSNRRLIWLATALGVAVTALSFIGAPGTLAALREATRTTAQLSGMFFALALMARGGFPRVLGENRLPLLMAFVAAHGVHLAMVATYAGFDPHNQLRTFNAGSVTTVVVGLGLLTLVAFTARATSGLALRLNVFSFYALWALFELAFLEHARGIAGGDGEPSAGILFLVLALAMAWRVAAPFIRPQPMAQAASARR